MALSIGGSSGFDAGFASMALRDSVFSLSLNGAVHFAFSDMAALFSGGTVVNDFHVHIGSFMETEN